MCKIICTNFPIFSWVICIISLRNVKSSSFWRATAAHSNVVYSLWFNDFNRFVQIQFLFFRELGNLYNLHFDCGVLRLAITIYVQLKVTKQQRY